MIADALADAGIRLSNWRPGVTYRLPCPQPGCRDKRRQALAVSIDADGRGAVWTCHRCGWSGNVHGGRSSECRPVPAPKLKQERVDLSPYARRLWSECRPIKADDSAGRYLLARHCGLPHPEGDLRWHPSLWHPSGHTGPALVGLVTDVHDAHRHLTLHRTWFDPDRPGNKADVDPPRLLLKDHPKTGGVIRLWPNCEVTLGLAVGEGIETCLAAARRFTPIWSAIDAGNLGMFPVLEGVDSLTIVCDRDAAGEASMLSCGRRWRDAKREVLVLYPERPGDDWCDQVRRAS